MSVYTAAQIEAVLGVKPGTLRQWVRRGHVTKLGRDLYDGDSVIARWRESEAAAELRAVDKGGEAPVQVRGWGAGPGALCLPPVPS